MGSLTDQERRSIYFSTQKFVQEGGEMLDPITGGDTAKRLLPPGWIVKETKPPFDPSTLESIEFVPLLPADSRQEILSVRQILALQKKEGWKPILALDDVPSLIRPWRSFLDREPRHWLLLTGTLVIDGKQVCLGQYMPCLKETHVELLLLDSYISSCLMVRAKLVKPAR